MSIRIAFFWVGDDIAVPEYLVRSVRLVAGIDFEIIQLSDLTTPVVPGVSGISRHALSDSIMVARLQAYSYLEWSSNFTYYCDADSIFISRPIVDSNSDILLCPRIDNFKINPRYPEYYPEFEGKMIMEVMPFMFGAIIARGKNNIFSSLLKKCLKLPARYHRWYGDQVALAKAVGAGNFTYSIIDPYIYLNVMSGIPTREHIVTLIDNGVQMITFKGPHVEKSRGLSGAYDALEFIYKAKGL